MTVLRLTPYSGVSGDMLLGALLGLGAPLPAVRAAITGTGITGWGLDVEQVTRAGLVATRAAVRVRDPATTRPAAISRPAAELLAIVGRARPEPVAALATAAVRALAEVEAALHGVGVDEVHLHEIGGVDTVVDCVGVAAGLHLLGVTEVHSAPLALGSGTVDTAHGELPLPAPATAALLARGRMPVTDAGVTGETVTPTGVALLLAAGTRFDPVPDMTVDAVGYGAGGRDPAGRPNVLPALLGTVPTGVGAAGVGAGGPGPSTVTAMVLLETTVDDVTGEVLGHLLEVLRGVGAADAWATPAVLRKSRPGHVLHVLAAPEHSEDCERLVLAETGSLGLRRVAVQRRALARDTGSVQVGGHRIRIKRGPHGAKPEHDDVAAVAAALGLPLREVARRALAVPADGRSPDGDGDLR